MEIASCSVVDIILSDIIKCTHAMSYNCDVFSRRIANPACAEFVE